MHSREPLLCRHCGVENFDAVKKLALPCPICNDERQYPDPLGQTWLTSSELDGYELKIRQITDGAYALTVEPKFGIGHTAYLLRSEPAWVLWDPLPVVDKRLSESLFGADGLLSGLLIAASHPHMFGAQSRWAEAFNGRVFINQHDSDWVSGDRFPHAYWDDEKQLGARAALIRIGGHFPGSSYLLWQTPHGRQWLFVSDTTQIRPNRRVAFQWSYPNMLPLGRREVEDMLARLPRFSAERAFDNFGREIRGDIREVIVSSAHGHIARVRS